MSEELDELLESPSMKGRISALQKAKSENERLRIIKFIFDEIRAASVSIVDQMKEGVAIDNLDEVTTALHNEFKNNIQKLLKAIEKMKLSNEEQLRIVAALGKYNDSQFDSEFQTFKIRKPKDKVVVTNLGDISFPSEFTVSNLSDLEKFFDKLSDELSKSLKIEIPAPKVTVNPTPVNIPETKINIPELNLQPLIKALDSGLNKIRTNDKSRPLAVRLTDGQNWIEQIVAKMGNIQTALAGFSDRVKLVTNNGQIQDLRAMGIASSVGDGSKDVAAAGTREALSSSSISCRYVIVTAKAANTDTIWLGGATVAAGRGRPLVALQSEKIDIDDVSKVYIDAAVSSEGVTYAYVS